MIPDEVLKEHGYRAYKVVKTSSYAFADCQFQKRFLGGDATLYFVNVYQYYPAKNHACEFKGVSSVEVKLYPSDTLDSEWVTIQIHGAKDLDYVEEFISNAYQKLEMVPDIHNQ